MVMPQVLDPSSKHCCFVMNVLQIIVWSKLGIELVLIAVEKHFSQTL